MKTGILIPYLVYTKGDQTKNQAAKPADNTGQAS